MKKTPLIFFFLGLILASCTGGQKDGDTIKPTSQVKNSKAEISMSCTRNIENLKIELHAKNGKVLRTISGTDIEGPKKQIKLEETNYLLMDGVKEYKWKDTKINGTPQSKKAWSRTLSEDDKIAYEKALTTEKPEFITALDCTEFSATDKVFEIPPNINFINQDEEYSKLSPAEKAEIMKRVFSEI